MAAHFTPCPVCPLASHDGFHLGTFDLDTLGLQPGAASGNLAGIRHKTPEQAISKNTELADAILNRLIHSSHKLELRGDSMRKRKSTSAK